jgi:hypothetical protein
MWSVGVVVLHVGVQDAIEMPTAQDERPVKELSSHRSNPSLSEGVGLWGSDRGEDHLRPFGLEHLIEGTGELLIPVADEVAHRRHGIVSIEGEVPRLLSDEGAIRVFMGSGVESSLLEFSTPAITDTLQEMGKKVYEVSGSEQLKMFANEPLKQTFDEYYAFALSRLRDSPNALLGWIVSEICRKQKENNASARQLAHFPYRAHSARGLHTARRATSRPAPRCSAAAVTTLGRSS